MNNFWAIIIVAVIIGGFVYFGLQNNRQVFEVGRVSDIRPTSTQAKSVAMSDAATTPAQSVAAAVACGATDNAIVTKVIDGDTVVVEGGWHVRLLGMDADEKGYPCYDTAKNRLEDLVLGKQVVLEKDVSDVDQYGRCLRYIFADDKNVDTQLVKEGLAIARFYAPDVKYRAEITSAELFAQQNKIGCKWSGALQAK